MKCDQKLDETDKKKILKVFIEKLVTDPIKNKQVLLFISFYYD